MDTFKKAFAFIFFMVAGIVLGAFLTSVCANTLYFDWMSWGKDIGIENASVDLYVVKFNLGFMIHATIAYIVTISLALILFAKVGKGL